MLLRNIETSHGLSFRFGQEIEFFLLGLAQHGGALPAPVDSTAYAQTLALNSSAQMLDHICADLKSLGITVEQYHAEAGPGQFEVVLSHDLGELFSNTIIQHFQYGIITRRCLVERNRIFTATLWRIWIKKHLTSAWTSCCSGPERVLPCSGPSMSCLHRPSNDDKTDLKYKFLVWNRNSLITFIIEQVFRQPVHWQALLRRAIARLSFFVGLAAADKIIFARETIAASAAAHGKTACFLPKPFADQAGSAAHTHLSLWCSKTSKNITATEGDDPRGRQFLAGLISSSTAFWRNVPIRHFSRHSALLKFACLCKLASLWSLWRQFYANPWKAYIELHA